MNIGLYTCTYKFREAGPDYMSATNASFLYSEALPGVVCVSLKHVHVLIPVITLNKIKHHFLTPHFQFPNSHSSSILNTCSGFCFILA